jgi:uncharacterized protein YjiS (DUF1127 family)
MLEQIFRLDRWSGHIGHRNCKGTLQILLLGLEVVMSSSKRLARATTTWLIRAGLGNDLTTLSDRDLRDVGLVRQQIGKAIKLFVLT